MFIGREEMLLAFGHSIIFVAISSGHNKTLIGQENICNQKSMGPPGLQLEAASPLGLRDAVKSKLLHNRNSQPRA